MEYLNSNFISALFGAATGALIPVLIEWWREQHRILSDINMTVGKLGLALKHLIGLKRNHACPLKEAFEKNKKLHQAGKPYELPLLDYKSHPFHFTPTERIFSCVSTKDVLKKIMHNIPIAERCLHEVEDAYATWKEICKNFEHQPEEEKNKRYFGLPIPYKSYSPTDQSIMDKIDERIPHTIDALLQSLDGALYYVDQSLQSIEAMKNKALRLRWLRKRVLKIQISGEDRELIPKDTDKENSNNA